MMSPDAIIAAVAPNALPTYRVAFLCASAVLPIFGVMKNEFRLSHFLAQLLHESGGLTRTVESLNYTALRITQVWPTRFPTVASAQPYARKPAALANKVYGGRMGNTVQADDGWRYIGRGMLQLTGRENYTRVGAALGIDLAGDPDLVLRPEFSLSAAAVVWKGCGGNEFADLDDLRKVTRAINGGYTGLLERGVWLTKVRRAMGLSETVKA
jgi:putative chitinase